MKTEFGFGVGLKPSILWLLCIILFNLKAIAQVNYFNQILRQEVNSVNCVAAGATENGLNIYIYCFSINSNFETFTSIIEVDESGNEIVAFDQILNPNMHVYNYESTNNTIVQLNNGDVIALIRSFDPDRPCPLSENISLARYHNEELIWRRNYNYLTEPCESNLEFIYNGIINYNDSVVVVYGTYYLGDPITERGTYFAYFDHDGELLDLNMQPIETSGYGLQKAFLLPDNQIIAECTLGQHRPIVAKYDNEANLIDSIQFGNPLIPYNFQGSGEVMNNGNFLYMYPFAQYYGGIANPLTKQDLHLTSINPTDMSINFDVILPTEMDGLYFNGWGVGATVKTSDNCLVVSTGYQHEGIGYRHIWKFNQDGELIWRVPYYKPSPEWDSWGVMHHLETSDGGILFVGGLNDFPAKDKVWIFKLDQCGYEEPVDCPEVIVDNISENTIPTFVAWPNPFHQELKANLPDDAILVEWLEMSGRIIHTEQVFYPKQSFNLAKLAEGNYIMRVVMQDGTSCVKRVVKQ